MSYKETTHSFDFGENAITITEHPHIKFITVKARVRIDKAVGIETTFVHEDSEGGDAVIIGFPDFNLTITGHKIREAFLDGLLAEPNEELEAAFGSVERADPAL